MKQKRIFTIPNGLSLLRLLLVPVFVWAYSVRKDDLMTALVLIASGLTDLLDGFIARRFDMVSDLGKALDPIADKVTQCAVLICLLARFPIMWAPLGLLVVKEVFLGVTHLMLIRRTGKVESAQLHGKIATCALDGLALLHLIWSGIPGWLSIVTTALTVILMLISLMLYSLSFVSRLRRLNTKRAERQGRGARGQRESA